MDSSIIKMSDVKFDNPQLQRGKLSSELQMVINTTKEKGFNVEFVGDDVLHDYAGMNPEAAKSMGFKLPDGSPMPDDVIYLDKKDTATHQTQTLRHELYELGLMRKGMVYFDAHKEALKHEK